MSLYLRFIWLGSVALALIFSLALQVSVIAEIAREKKQRDREGYKRPRKANNLALHRKILLGLPVCRHRSLIGYDRKAAQQGRKTRNRSCDGRYGDPFILKRFLVNVREEGWNFLPQILMRKSKDALAFLFCYFTLPFKACFFRLIPWRDYLGIHDEEGMKGTLEKPYPNPTNTWPLYMTYIV